MVSPTQPYNVPAGMKSGKYDHSAVSLISMVRVGGISSDVEVSMTLKTIDPSNQGKGPVRLINTIIALSLLRSRRKFEGAQHQSSPVAGLIPKLLAFQWRRR